MFLKYYLRDLRHALIRCSRDFNMTTYPLAVTLFCYNGGFSLEIKRCVFSTRKVSILSFGNEIIWARSIIDFFTKFSYHASSCIMEIWCSNLKGKKKISRPLYLSIELSSVFSKFDLVIFCYATVRIIFNSIHFTSFWASFLLFFTVADSSREKLMEEKWR